MESQDILDGEGGETNQVPNKWASVMRNIINKKPNKIRNEGKSKKSLKTESESPSTTRTLKKVKKYKRLESSLPNKELDRKLARIATKGVVNLFNAVSAQKKIAEQKLSESKGLTFKEDKVIKSLTVGSFLDLLKEDKLDKPKRKRSLLAKQSIDQNNKSLNGPINKDAEKPTWHVLQNNFLLNNSLSNWDKENTSKFSELNQTIEDIVF